MYYLLDINECAEGTDGCTHQCVNTISSYYCTCNTGYSLNADLHWCSGISKKLTVILFYN